MKTEKTKTAWSKIFTPLAVLTLALSPISPRFVLSAGAELLATEPNFQAVVAPRQDYAAAVEMLERLIAQEMADKELPALSIALVDDQQIVWAKGFGFADPKAKVPATAETIYRVGSVSKLFTDIAIMQLVEQGKLNLDAPASHYIPAFQPRNPFGKPITLRQMMSHRSGLVREPPVGNYFDPTEPSLAKTIGSLNNTALVYSPETHTKYSNAAIATVGYALERIAGQPFVKYLKRAVLDPLGLAHSSFEPTPEITRNLAKAYMWTVDGRVFEAPTFQLGIGPAGSMYTTVTDLGRFMSALFASGRGVLKPATLEQMWTPQFAKPGQKTGFGIGFHLGELEGHRQVGHGGAIYGFATSLETLPDEKLGVVVVTTKDAANAVTNHIANVALRAMLAARQRRPIPQPEVTAPVDPEFARRIAGRYVNGDKGIDLIESAGTLSLLSLNGGEPAQLRKSGDALIVDGRLGYGEKLFVRDGAVVIGNETFKRAAVSRPQPTPVQWRGLIGEYGWDHDILYIFEKDAKLWALIEWFEFDPLEQVSENVFKFPDRGLYDGERLIFTRDKSGRASQVEAANVVFKRRKVGPEEGAAQLRVLPLRPVDELLKEAIAAQPPKEMGEFRSPDLVELTRLDPTIKLEIRYATTDNFLGAVFYSEARAFLQRPAAEALVSANRKLREQGYGLLIHDGYRPWYVTKVFWDATPDDKKIFVADPSKGSRHNRGAAVDLTLYDLKTGKPVEMVSTYDETTDRAYPDYPGGTSLQRWHRRLLRDAMESEGFTVFEAEWWHFDYKDWQKYPIGNVPFDKLMASANVGRDDAALARKVDGLFAQWDKPDSPGCALGVIKDGRFIYQRGYGMANLDYNIPLSPQSVFYLASVSKQFTAISALLLARQEKLSLDDPIRKFVPELPELYSQVTVRHLIHHTSGIRDYLTLVSLAGNRLEEVSTNEEALELIARQKELNFKPGEQYLYSNSGYVLLAIIVQRVSGGSLRQFAEENIFKPLGMNSTRYKDDRAMIIKNRAVSYSVKPSGGFRAVVSHFELVGDGGLMSSVEDLGLWDRDFYENKLGGGGRDLIEQALATGTLNSGKKIDYAFGLVVTEYKGLKVIDHGGAFVGYRTDIIRFPAQRFSVICLCNAENANASSLARQVADVYLSGSFIQDQAKAAPVSNPTEKFIELPERELKNNAGAYRNPTTGSIWKLSVQDGKLVADISGQIFQLAPLSETHFRAVGGPVKVEVNFQRQAPHKPAVMSIEVEDQQPVTLEAIEIVTPTSTQLAEYVGDYYSDELQATYKIIGEGGKLMLKRKNAPMLPLSPTFKDQFAAGPANVSFIRNAQNRVSGFTVNAGRVTNIRFVRNGH